jgi:hypothetical protein
MVIQHGKIWLNSGETMGNHEKTKKKYMEKVIVSGHPTTVETEKKLSQVADVDQELLDLVQVLLLLADQYE